MTADVSEDLSSEAQLVTQTVLRVTQAVQKNVGPLDGVPSGLQGMAL